jgi:predicted phage terminase large subunit-like protein
MQVLTLSPQAGPQTKFLSTTADIAGYGGSAGGGKSFALLLEACRNIAVQGYEGVIFRQTSEQIRMAGGLWSESQMIYRALGGTPNEQQLQWKFKAGSSIRFEHLARESDKYIYQGAQFAFLGFDELTHFSESQFFYMLSRNRSTCGIRPYIRATFNPDPDSWVKEFFGAWVDPEHPDPAESGEIRYFVRSSDGDIEWVPEGTPRAKSVTFIRSSIHDNQILLERDPGYLDTLMSLSLVDRKRLLDGSWVDAQDGDFFKREWFKFTDQPLKCKKWVRFWDFASTEFKEGTDPDWTCGVLMGLTDQNQVCIADVKLLRGTPLQVETLVRQTAEEDGKHVEIVSEEEGGSSGKFVTDHFVREVLIGFSYKGERSTGSKSVRAKPLSSFTEHGNVYLMKAPWNKKFINQLCRFPDPKVHDDQVDGASGAFNALAVPTGWMSQLGDFKAMLKDRQGVSGS